MCLFRTPKAKAMETAESPIETVEPVDLAKGRDLTTEGEKTEVSYGDNKKSDGTPQEAPKGLQGLKINSGSNVATNTGGINTTA